MARAKPNTSGEGKTPLVIGLVFFVLSTIILGVLAYTFQGDNAAAEARAVEAKKDTEDARGKLSKTEDQLKLHRVLLGHGSEEERLQLSSSANKEFLREEHAKIMERINNRMKTAIEAEKAQFVGVEGDKWNPKPAELFSWLWPAQGEMLAAPSPGSLVETIVKQRAEREMAMRKLNAEKQTIVLADAELKAAKLTYEKEKADYTVKITAIAATLKKLSEDRNTEVAKIQANFKDEAAKSATTLGNTNKDLDAAIQQAKDTGDTLRNTLEQLDRAIVDLGKKDDLARFDAPNGRITATFVSQDTVEIDLGSADRLPPGQTFRVHGSDEKDNGFKQRMRMDTTTGKPELTKSGEAIYDRNNPAPKAMIQVVEILGAHLSRARVTFYYDRNRESVLKGDYIYNASWRKDSADRVVLTGIFDINGDGSDDIKTVARDLTARGIAVDGVFDLSSRKWIKYDPASRTWVAGGPTTNTTLSIEGSMPSASLGDALAKEKGELINSINLALQEAAKKGATLKKAHNYFPSIGFVAKTVLTDLEINQVAAKYLRTNVAPEGGEPK